MPSPQPPRTALQERVYPKMTKKKGFADKISFPFSTRKKTPKFTLLVTKMPFGARDFVYTICPVNFVQYSHMSTPCTLSLIPRGNLMRKAIFSALVMLAFVSSASAYTLSGSISDASGNALAGANITIEDTDLGGATDERLAHAAFGAVDAEAERRVHGRRPRSAKVARTSWRLSSDISTSGNRSSGDSPMMRLRAYLAGAGLLSMKRFLKSGERRR